MNSINPQIDDKYIYIYIETKLKEKTRIKGCLVALGLTRISS